MDKHVLRTFQREVELQCQFALIAVKDLNSANEAKDMPRLWYSLQSFLVAVANVSKLLWNPKVHMSRRALALRQSLGVQNNSPLQPKLFRNPIDRFDERLEEWAMASKRHNVVDSNVVSPGMISGIDPQDELRNFDHSRCAVTFQGEEHELQPVIDAIVQLRKAAAQAMHLCSDQVNQA